MYNTYKSGGRLSDSGGSRSTDSAAMYAGSGRNVDPHEACGAYRRETLPYAGLQDDVRICRTDIGYASGTDYSHRLILGAVNTSDNKKKGIRIWQSIFHPVYMWRNMTIPPVALRE